MAPINIVRIIRDDLTTMGRYEACRPEIKLCKAFQLSSLLLTIDHILQGKPNPLSNKDMSDLGAGIERLVQGLERLLGSTITDDDQRKRCLEIKNVHEIWGQDFGFEFPVQLKVRLIWSLKTLAGLLAVAQRPELR